MGGSPTIRISATRIEAFRIQSSVYGATVPLLFGVNRCPVNLAWYGDFQAIASTKTERSGGKGGGGAKTKTTTYSYKAAGILAICHGPIQAVRTVFVGKEKRPWAAAQLALYTGELGQPTWTHLTTTHADQAIPYSGLAYMASPAYQLNDSAQLENHNVIAEGLLAGTFEQEADLPDCMVLALSNERYGANFPSSLLGSVTYWKDYLRAFGMKFSPILTTQMSAADMLERAMQISNSQVVWSEGKLKFVPLGDKAATGNGSTYTPNITPVYDLDHRVLLPLEGSSGPMVRVRRKLQADAKNHVRIQFLNRDHDYNIEVVEAKDQANIDVYGLRSADVIEAHWITDPIVAGLVAHHILQRLLGVRNEYEFRLPWFFSHLEAVVDFVTLTDPPLMVDRPVRIIEIDEDDRGRLKLVAEDAPPGVGNAALYPTEVGTGYAPDFNADPGDVVAPTFLEPPVELAGSTGLEVWVAVTGATSTWGGCQVWASYDGTNYKQLGTVFGGARYGTLTAGLAAAPGGSASVLLAGQGGQLLSGSAAEAQALATLCWVRGTGPTDPPEWLAYEDATLTGASAYTLAGLVRGAYGSKTPSRSSGARFVRVDDAIVRSEPLARDMIGQTLYFKFPSFNVYGAGLQQLDEVDEYTYTVTGEMALLPPVNVSSFLVSVQSDGTRQFDWSWSTDAPKPPDVDGVVIRYRQGHGSYTWQDMLPFETPGVTGSNQGYYTASPLESNQLLAGDYTFAIRARDRFGVEAETTLFQLVTFPDPRLGDSLVYRVLHEEGWPGTLTDCVIDTDEGEVVLRADDQAVWSGGASNVPIPWSAWTRWVWDPVPTWTYDAPQEDFGAVVGFVPVAQWTADGDVAVSESHSSDGSTWTSYAPLAGLVTARYVRVRVVVAIPSGSPTGPGITPLTILRRLALAYKGKVTSEIVNDLDPTTLGAARLAAGHYQLPLSKPYVRHSRWGVTLQNVGAGWDVDYINPTTTGSGLEVKTYNGSGVLADPPLLDYWMEGIVP